MNKQLSYPKVSIITPARNAVDTISTTINSVRSQVFSDWEMLIVNDDSDDDTANVVTKLMESDSRIRLLQGNGDGVSVARNLGLDNARGQYISFLDADDIYYPDSLGARVSALDEHEDWAVAYCPVELTDDNFQTLGWRIGWQKDHLKFDDMHANRTHVNAIMGRASVMKGQRFQAGMTNGEDWLYMSRVMRTGAVFHQVESVRVAYRLRSDSTVGKDYVAHETKLRQVLEIIYGEDTDCQNPLPAYAGGIENPPFGRTLLQRQCGLLTFLLLSGRPQEARTVAAENQNSEFWPHLPKAMIEASIKFSVARFYLCHTDLWKAKFRELRASVLETMEASDLEEIVPSYTAVLLEQLNGPASAQHTNGAAVSKPTAPQAPDSPRPPATVTATKKAPANLGHSKPNKKKEQRSASLVGRIQKIARTFLGRRGFVAVGTLVFMTLGATDLPYSWGYTAVGTVGLLVLVGQLAGTKNR